MYIIYIVFKYVYIFTLYIYTHVYKLYDLCILVCACMGFTRPSKKNMDH